MSATPQEKRVALPTGTVTFAFTDIEGSTARWDAREVIIRVASDQDDFYIGMGSSLIALLRERLSLDDLARLLAEGASLTTEAALALAD